MDHLKTLVCRLIQNLPGPMCLDALPGIFFEISEGKTSSAVGQTRSLFESQNVKHTNSCLCRSSHSSVPILLLPSPATLHPYCLPSCTHYQIPSSLTAETHLPIFSSKNPCSLLCLFQSSSSIISLVLLGHGHTPINILEDIVMTVSTI